MIDLENREREIINLCSASVFPASRRAYQA